MTFIRRSARDGEIELLYFDEAGFSCLPNVQRSWSPLGRPHTADASFGRKRANVMGALDYARAQLHFEVCDHTVRREDVIRFLDRLAQSSPADKWTFLVMDNASMHHHIDPAITDRWLIKHRFLPLYLPPYSPELNLIELKGDRPRFLVCQFCMQPARVKVSPIWPCQYTKLKCDLRKKIGVRQWCVNAGIATVLN